MSSTLDAAPNVAVKRELPPGVYLVLGVVVVPALIALLSPSGVEPGTETFVMMAFAVIAGQTIAVLTAVGVLVAAIIRRSKVSRIAVFGVIAVVTASMALSTASAFAEQIVRAFA